MVSLKSAFPLRSRSGARNYRSPVASPITHDDGGISSHLSNRPRNTGMTKEEHQPKMGVSNLTCDLSALGAGLLDAKRLGSGHSPSLSKGRSWNLTGQKKSTTLLIISSKSIALLLPMKLNHQTYTAELYACFVF